MAAELNRLFAKLEKKIKLKHFECTHMKLSVRVIIDYNDEGTNCQDSCRYH